MQTNIKQTQPSEYEMEITATADDLAPKIEEALRAQRTRTSMKGFRPGKVPMSLVKKMYGRALAYEIAERSIQELYDKEVIGTGTYDVMGQPKLTVLNYEDIDGELRAVVRFGVRPQFDLQEIKGEKVTRLVHEVSDEDVEKEIERLRMREAELEPLEGTAGEEDFAIVDLQRLDDASGTPLIGEKEEGVSFFLNDPRLKDELRDALIGKSAGDVVRVNLPHTHDHAHEHEHEHEHEHGHGHTHGYEVTVRELKKRVLPELTPEFIKASTQGAAEDEQALREFIEKSLKSAWSKQTREYLHERIVDRMIALHEIEVPESIVDVYIDSFVEDVKGRNEGKLPAGFDEARFREANRGEATRQAKWALIRDQVVEHAALEVTDEDRERHFQESAGESDVTPDALAQFYRSVPRLSEQLDQQLLSEKVFDHLASQFEIEEKDRDAVEAEIRARAEQGAQEP